MHACEMIDVAFDVTGGSVPAAHACALRAAVVAVLPWFAATAAAGIHPLKGSGTADGELLLARRARLVLRVPAHRGADCAALEGRSLSIGDRVLKTGHGQVRALRPFPTLHAVRVTSVSADGGAFQDEVAAGLAALDVTSPFISGRERRDDAGARTIRGFALSVHELSPAASLRLQAAGIGADRALGWGIFVPAKAITMAD